MTKETYIKELDKILKRTSTIEELEKIKEDLKSEIDFDVEKMRFYINSEDIDRVFYKHISELRGDK